MGVIIRANAGLVVPKGYLKRACAVNQSFWGIAYPEDGKLQMDLAGEQPTVETVSENLEIYKDYPVVFHLGSAPKDHSPDIMQPHVLLGPVENPLMVGFLDGDFSAYEDKAQPKLDGAYLCVHKRLKPKLEKLFKLCGNDLKKLIDEIDADNDFEIDMDKLSGVHGNIVLVTATGECMEFVKNDNAENFDWGWASQNYGYTGEEATPAPTLKAGAPAAATNLQKLKDAVAAKKDNVVQLNAPTNVTNEPPKGRDATTAILMKCPNNITKSKARKRWFKTFAGYLPNDWQQLPAVWVLKADAEKAASGRLGPANQVLNSLKDLKTAVAIQPDAGTAAEEDTDEDNEASEAAADKAANAPLHEKLPTIDPKDLVEFKDWYKSKAYEDLKILHQGQIGDPTKFAELESKIPDFVTALGMSGPEEILQWTPAMRYYIIVNFPSIGSAMLDYFIKLHVEDLSKDDRPTVAATQPTVTTPPAPSAAPAGRARILKLNRKGAQLPG
jgi:hypothetical protein